MIRARFLRCGDRVELLRYYSWHPHTRLQPGEQGTVRRVDAEGKVHVEWDCGLTFSVDLDHGDRIRLVKPQAASNGSRPEVVVDPQQEIRELRDKLASLEVKARARR